MLSKTNLRNISAGLFLLCPFLIEAQVFTQWEHDQPPSDFYVTINWSALTASGCDCYDPDEIYIYLAGFPDYLVHNETFLHADPQTQTTAIAMGPGRSHNFFGELVMVGDYNIGGDTCNFACPGGIATSSSIVMYTTGPVNPTLDYNAITHNENGSLTFHWTMTTDIPEAYCDLHIYKNSLDNPANLVAILPKSATEWTDPCAQVGDFYHFYTYYSGDVAGQATTAYSNPSSYTFVAQDFNAPNGSISGRVRTRSCQGVSGITVRATLTNPEELDNGSCWPTEYTTTTTGSNGTYQLNGLYYGTGSDIATYEIEAEFTEHQFRRFISESGGNCNYSPNDSIHTAELSELDPTELMLDFVDITSYTISGRITSSGDTCGLGGVTVEEAPGGSGGIAPGVSNEDGYYTVTVPEGNGQTYNIYARYDDNWGSIEDSIITVQIFNDDTTGIDFTHTSTDTLRGFIGGACNEGIGIASLEVRRPDDQCVIASVLTNASGYYEIVLPSRPLNIEVVSIDLSPDSELSDESEVLSGFGGPRSIELDSTTEQNFIYHLPLSLQISGFPAPSCAAIDVPILAQGKEYSLNLQVFEGNNCVPDTGVIYITNYISGTVLENVVFDTVLLSQGHGVYEFVPGIPNFIGDNQKDLTFQVQVGNQMTTVTIPAIVTGAKNRGPNFITAAPTEMPFLILRDPPGDQSYSFFEESNTTALSHTFLVQGGGSVKTWLTVKAGVDFFGFGFYGQIGGSLQVTASGSTTEEFVVEMSNTQYFSTASNEDIVGEKGDLFMGAAVNLMYSLADELSFDLNTCSLVKDTVLMLNANGFETTFIYTEDHIRTEVIPDLQMTVDNPMAEDSVRHRAANDIKLWEQTLQLNQDLKAEALENGTNYSFDGGIGEFGETVVGSATSSKTIEFTTQIDAGIALEAGLFFGGSEITGGVDINFQSIIGEVNSTTNTTTTSTGYLIDDDDSGDAFSIDIAVDPIYATPVFNLIAGQTSCPYEPGSARRDLFSMTVDAPVQEVESGNDAFFTFRFQNNSETEETRSFRFAFNSLTANGAEVSSAGNDFGTDILIPNVPSGAEVIKIVKVTRPEGFQQYDFEGLEFYMYPDCYPSYTSADLVATSQISAYFPSTCSNIDLAAPLNGWVINNSTPDSIPITISGYDLDSDFDNVILQYSLVGTPGWVTSNVLVDKEDLLVGSTVTQWYVGGIADGRYNIRLRLACGTTYSFSNRTTGNIDRTIPNVFGLEKPTDDIYRTGSEISVKFDEMINGGGLGPDDVFLMTLPDSMMVPCTFTYTDDKVKVNPSVNIRPMYNQLFQAGIIGISDIFDNMREDTVKWEFIVSEPDSDGDGIPDTKDRCPGGNDYIDSDLDGLPDDCDCLPNVASNGRLLTEAALNFDGSDDIVTIANSAELIPTSSNAITFEAWLNPKDTSAIFNDVIVASAGNLRLTRTNLGLHVVTGDSVLTPVFIPRNTWSHLAVTIDAIEIEVFLNGQSEYVSPLTSSASNMANPITIGGKAGSVDSLFKGNIEEIRFWSSIRSQSEINQSMLTKLIGDEADLVAYYNLDEGTPFGNNSDLGTIVDGTANGHDGALSGFSKTGIISNWVNSPIEVFGTPYELCKSCPDTVNAALDLDGNDDYLSVANTADLIPTTANVVTYEMWVLLHDNSPGVKHTLIASGNDLLVQIYGDVLQILTSVDTTASPITVVENAWNHLAFIFDLTELNVYMNGNLIQQVAIANNASNSGAPVTFGGSVNHPSQLLYGQFDDIRVWDYALTQDEIVPGLQQERTGEETGLVAYYNINNGLPEGDNTGITTVPDITTNGNTASVIGFDKMGSSSNWITSPVNFSDADLDGLPDPCDDCYALKNIILSGMVIDGTFSARETITLGAGTTFEDLANIFLRAPKVIISEYVEPQANVTITVTPVPCEE